MSAIEALQWHTADEQLPDDGITVLVHAPDDSEPVWPGYHEGGRWLSAEGFEIANVIEWAEMPAGTRKRISSPDLAIHQGGAEQRPLFT